MDNLWQIPPVPAVLISAEENPSSVFESLIYIRLGGSYNETGRHMYESSLDIERLAAIIVLSEPLSLTELEG